MQSFFNGMGNAMEGQSVTVRLPAELIEQAKHLQANRESFNELVIEAITREVRRRKALAAHQRIVARSAEVEHQTGVQASSLDLIHGLREGEGRRG
jgi:hypothetical protein